MPALETASATENILLTQTRVIRAKRAKVYEALTNPEIVEQWFGSPAMYCSSATLDVRVGGKYRIEGVRKEGSGVTAEDICAGRPFNAVVGEYTKVIPNELLQFTWTAAWAPEEQSLVTVSLKDAPGGTEIILLHERFLSEASRDAHDAGWIYALGSIDKVVVAS